MFLVHGSNRVLTLYFPAKRNKITSRRNTCTTHTTHTHKLYMHAHIHKHILQVPQPLSTRPGQVQQEHKTQVTEWCTGIPVLVCWMAIAVCRRLCLLVLLTCVYDSRRPQHHMHAYCAHMQTHIKKSCQRSHEKSEVTLKITQGIWYQQDSDDMKVISTSRGAANLSKSTQQGLRGSPSQFNWNKVKIILNSKTLAWYL